MPEIEHPINAFPEEVQKIICHYSEAKGYPIEYFIQGFLGAASTAIGRSVTLNTGNFTAIGSLWCIILGKRGYTKSEPLDDAFNPIRAYQFTLLDKHKAEMDEYHEYKANNPKSKLEPPPEPTKHTINDTTPEKLVMMLAANPKGIGMVYDEIAGFVGRFNRYNAGADEQMYLTLFNGSSVMRDRMNGASAFAKHTYLTIIGTTQPSVLKAVFFDKSESGFFDRWLITQPDGFKKQYPNQFGVNNLEKAKYSKILNTLLSVPFDENNAFQMAYTTDSYRLINDFQKFMIDEQNETDNDDYRGVLAKMEIYLHKFALLIQCIYFTYNNEIEYVSVEAANGAIILTKYFIDQAQKVRIQDPIEQLKNEWPEVYRQLPSPGINFTRNEFVKKCSEFSLKESVSDKFLRANADRSEKLLFYKVKQGIYTKNLF
jgi:hypothetical protein